jgi:hypothetical protein
MHDSLDGNSKVSLVSDLQLVKQDFPITSTDEGIQTDKSD